MEFRIKTLFSFSSYNPSLFFFSRLATQNETRSFCETHILVVLWWTESKCDSQEERLTNSDEIDCKKGNLKKIYMNKIWLKITFLQGNFTIKRIEHHEQCVSSSEHFKIINRSSLLEFWILPVPLSDVTCGLIFLLFQFSNSYDEWKRLRKWLKPTFYCNFVVSLQNIWFKNEIWIFYTQ